MLALIIALSIAADPMSGTAPFKPDGTAYNLGFESGTLADWTATGDALADQPVKGDTVAARRKDMKSNHQGDWWIGTYEKHGDKPTGTLTSTAFKAAQPWASFLVGGGASAKTRVEIVAAGTVIFKASGEDSETMRRVAVDLTKHVGSEIQIRIVDEGTGGWGHINFDDFRFHAEKPAVAEPLKLATLKYAGLKPEDAAKAMTVPEGFNVTLFAGEPDVHQPIAFCFDDRGRLWVVEAFQYPLRDKTPGPLLADKTKGDKILIFEDTDGDGKFDKRTVFLEGLNLVSGIEYGFGGLYIGAAPYLLHIPIKDDKPAGEPIILLDGFGYEDTHETLNSFVWGPDGWLYGCHGVFTHSKVGKPGSKDSERVPINAGVWRYHPTRKVFERYAEGTSNPWGLDYNQYGDFFASACVIPHLYHIVQGGRYTRQAGQHFNPHTYIEIPTIADHLHYQGNQWNNTDRAKSNDAGGGHAHCGLMCYQGGAWPKEYHGQLFMGNIHGRRINVDIPEPKGSTYVARHGKDFLFANDAWARFTAMKYGPDGNVYVTDWYDEQACHHRDPAIWNRSNGRIYKISYRSTKPVTNLDLAKCTDEELVKYQTHENEWYAAHARRILQERFADSPIAAARKESMSKLIRDGINLKKIDDKLQLRLLWTGFVTDSFDQNHMNTIVFDSLSSYVRGWCVTMAFQNFNVLHPKQLPAEQKSEFLNMLAHNANVMIDDPTNPIFIRHLASSFQYLPRDYPESLFTCLIMGDRFLKDPIINHLFWYAAEPLADRHPKPVLLGVLTWGNKTVLPFAIKRVLAGGSSDAMKTVIAEMEYALEHTVSDAAIFLNSLAEYNRSKPDPKFASAWKAIRKKYSDAKDDKTRDAAMRLDVVLRDPDAMKTMRMVIADSNSPSAMRETNFQLLVDIRDPDLEPLFKTLINDNALRGMVIRAMASLGGAEAPRSILDVYSKLSQIEKRDAIATLASKPTFAMVLLEAIEKKSIPATDVPAETIRQLRAFNDAALNAKVVAVWGTVRDTPADRKKLIAAWKAKLMNSHEPDLAAGRAVFAKTCMQCHTLYGMGGSVGPDITGSNRADVNYLLENIFDPSAVIPKEYAVTVFDLADGRKVTGIVKQDGPQISVQTATDLVKFAAADVEKRVSSELSMMPDDITRQASDTEIKNLFAYLRNSQQVPMKATPENAKDFFNGKDLTGWDGDKDVWSVENGEIVGKTKDGLKKNNFLKSTLEADDFKLTLKVKLTPNKENSGVQFRSVPHLGHEMKGPQADIGAGWWGKLYEESGRGLLAKEGGEKFVKENDWNEYVIEAKGSTVKGWLNGNAVFELTDDKLAKKGIFALQVHSGGPMEVRFKDLKLEVLK